MIWAVLLQLTSATLALVQAIAWRRRLMGKRSALGVAPYCRLNGRDGFTGREHQFRVKRPSQFHETGNLKVESAVLNLPDLALLRDYFLAQCALDEPLGLAPAIERADYMFGRVISKILGNI